MKWFWIMLDLALLILLAYVVFELARWIMLAMGR